MEIEDPGEPLSDPEFRELVRQPVYMVMSRGLPPNWQDETFTTIWPLPTHLREELDKNGGQQE